jgi:hypothetical protein
VSPSAQNSGRQLADVLGTIVLLVAHFLLIGCIAQLAVAFGAAAMESLAGPVSGVVVGRNVSVTTVTQVSAGCGAPCARL